MFSAVASSYVAVTVMSKNDLRSMQLQFEEELYKVEEARGWVMKYGVPFMDFRIYRKTHNLMIYKKIFKDACRRLVRINKAVDSDVGEIIEMLHRISENSYE